MFGMRKVALGLGLVAGITSPAWAGVQLDFSELTITKYANPGQDGGGTAIVFDSGAALELSGNNWFKVELPPALREITEDIVLELEYFSTDLGEAQGLIFDNDNQPDNTDLNRGALFYLGQSSWPAPTVDDPYTSSDLGQWKQYTIAIGQMFTGNFQYLVFFNDEDRSGQTANASFRNVTFNLVPEPTSLALFGLGGLLMFRGKRKR